MHSSSSQAIPEMVQFRPSMTTRPMRFPGRVSQFLHQCTQYLRRQYLQYADLIHSLFLFHFSAEELPASTMMPGTEAGKAEAATAGPRRAAASLLCRGRCVLPEHDVSDE